MCKLKIAICQHSLSADIEQNLNISLKQLKIASEKGAEVALFPECNLTGYAGLEFYSYKEKEHKKLQMALNEIQKLSKELKLWTIVGGYSFDEGKDLPYNSLFVINDRGELAFRYDKRLLTAGDSGWDDKYFEEGENVVCFEIKGVKCGILICHEWRYPELYREYKKLGVQIIFQSWYDASVDKAEYSLVGKDHGSLIMGAVRSNAANNYLWIAGSNASNRESSIASFLVQPDGVIKSKLWRNKSGVLLDTVDTSEKFIDPSVHNRARFI